jgi:hypothetical protein
MKDLKIEISFWEQLSFLGGVGDQLSIEVWVGRIDGVSEIAGYFN